MMKVRRFFVYLQNELETKEICVDHCYCLDLACKRYLLSH